ncbi:hypothetical protein [Noviherbaspirillum autotrophicum]|uniref:Uncharacterized protein n=1 Tax=Noviherbaspirillum autotrophicum TaxID=709839 RepID=A0A0C2BPS0_9BURK|nr:hypothetical protein [Noviherbaspirillum autotrophicum]KIF83295.1 hypothetical protein TSA66_24625 [Noviherbaspirillum autotrophicum]
MMLENALFDFCKAKLATGTGWYDWKINWDKVPAGIAKTHGNDYEQNVALKNALSADWQAGDASRRRDLEHYYIAVWGGVRTNSPDKLQMYFGNTDAENIALGKSGIASWSKALTVRDPRKHAIYDARVGAALSALQIRDRVAHPVRFPLLLSRNTLIASRNPMLKQWADEHHWPAISPSFYSDYLDLCRKTTTRLRAEVRDIDVQIYTVEMVLFAHAEALVWAALPTA